MSLKEDLKNFGCSDDFIKVALTYSKYLKDDLEEFIELVEERELLAEEEAYKKLIEKEQGRAEQLLNGANLFGEDDDGELLEDY